MYAIRSYYAQEVLSKALFRQGFSLFEAGQYGDAIVVLRNFVQRFPADSRKAEALVWLGGASFKNEESYNFV